MASNATPFLLPCDDPCYLGAIGSYLIERLLGEGGTSLVFKGSDPALSRAVAVRVLKPTLARSEEEKTRFLAECRNAGAVEHPNVVAVFEVCEGEGWPYSVMAYNDGETLGERLEREGGLPIETVCSIGGAVADGLEAIHSAGFIHRDLKPDNVLISADGKVRVGDFGTTEGTAGTPHYQSPEQVDAKALDHRTDLFNLGLVLCEMSTGRRLISGDSISASAQQIVLGPQPDFDEDVPPWFQRLLVDLLKRDRNHRPASAAEISRALREQKWMGQTEPNQRRRLVIGGIAVASGMAVTGFVTLALRYEPPEGTPVYIDKKPQRFESIMSAIAAAPPGATIVLRDGVHEIPEAIEIERPVHLRAEPGTRPVLKSLEALKGSLFLIRAETKLEGLTLSHTPTGLDADRSWRPILEVEAPLEAVHCRIERIWKEAPEAKGSATIDVTGSGTLNLTRCEVDVTSSLAIRAVLEATNQSVAVTLNECAITAYYALYLRGKPGASGRWDVTVSKCHLLAGTAFGFQNDGSSLTIPHWVLKDSVFDIDYALTVAVTYAKFADAILPRLTWKGARNIYSLKEALHAGGKGAPPIGLRRRLAGWLSICPSAREDESYDAPSPNTVILPKLPDGYTTMPKHLQGQERFTATDLGLNDAMRARFPTRGGDMRRVGPGGAEF